MTHEFKRGRFGECHFPALGLGLEERGAKGPEGRGRGGVEVQVVGINPPEEVTSLASLVAGEEKSGIGLWRGDRYGVQRELMGKRIKRGWRTGMEEGVFVNVGLEKVVEELVQWDGGECGNEWFPKMDQLPWCGGDGEAHQSLN